MAEDNYLISAERRKRVERLKKIIILLLLVSIMIPIVCCVVLFVQVHNLNRRMGAMEAQMGQLAQLTQEQQEFLQEWLDSAGTTVQGDANQGQAPVEMTDVSSMRDAGAVNEANLHKVYLTFDDGPSMYTDEILDILARYDVKATFFVVGKEGKHAKEMMRRIVEEGHTIGLHSYSHKYSSLYDSKEAFAEDFRQIQDYVYQVTGVESHVYRFPGGSSNTVSDVEMLELAEYLAEQDVEFYDWNISSGDGGSRNLDVDILVENTMADIGRWERSIVLLHDAAEKQTTVEALPIIIENILAMENTVILPITEDTKPVHHIDIEDNK